MKIIYLILVMILVSCATPKKTILATEIEIKADGQSSVVTPYSDSTTTIVNLTPEGDLIDSTTIKW